MTNSSNLNACNSDWWKEWLTVDLVPDWSCLLLKCATRFGVQFLRWRSVVFEVFEYIYPIPPSSRCKYAPASLGRCASQHHLSWIRLCSLLFCLWFGKGWVCWCWLSQCRCVDDLVWDGYAGVDYRNVSCCLELSWHQHFIVFRVHSLIDGIIPQRHCSHASIDYYGFGFFFFFEKDS